MAMASRSKLILTISAAILFALALLLDVSDFGQDGVGWESVEITRILRIIAIVAAIGLSLGLFLFRKKKYKRRLFWTVPIAFILFSIAGISMVTITHYGLDEQYNYFTAKQDIRNGKVQILQIGLTMPIPNVDFEKQQEAEKKLADHFGYKSVYLGCTETSGIAIYNSVVEEYLEKVNGKGWRIKERQMLDSILKSNP